MAKPKPFAKQAGFFIPPGYFILAGIVVVVIGIGLFVHHKNHKPAPTLSGSTSAVNSDNPAADKIQNFYDCFETSGSTYYPGSPNKCVAYGKLFSEPTKFTDDDVIGGDSLPVGVRGAVFADAKENFDKCGVQDSQDQSSVPVTQVLSVLGSDWTYVGLSCKANTNEIYQKQADGSWQLISSTNQRLTCDVANKYQIPKELFLRSTNVDDHSNTCVNSDGTTTQIPYTYQPSGTNPQTGGGNQQ